MFLALTSLENFWNKREKILFLGEWCKVYNRKEVIDKIDHEVLPYHWDDRDKLYNDYLYIDDLYELLLPILSNSLNAIHDVHYSTRYWRIIVGFWLNWFIGVIFDRYESIRTAEEYGEISLTYILDPLPGAWTPNDFNRFRFLSERSDHYNLYLYSEIIKRKNTLQYEVKNDPVSSADSEELPGRFSNIGSFKRILTVTIQRILAAWDKSTATHFAKYFLSSAEIDFTHKIWLQLSLCQIPFFGYYKPSIPVFHFDPSNRNQILTDFEPRNEFEKLLTGLIKEQIPKCYVEGYNSIANKAMGLYPKNPRIIFSDNTLHSNEYFKYWAADKVETGALFAVGQHGGLYGTAKWFAAEKHEIKVSDIYYSWGWDDRNKKIKPLPSIKLNKRKKITQKADGSILMVTSLSGRYSYHHYSEPIAASGYLAHLNDHFSFINNLSSQSRTELIVRLYPHDRGKWFQKERFSDRFPDVQNYLGSKTFHRQLEESKLFIGTYNATTFLETFVANFPTILFWNPMHWELRETAQPYFDELRQAGILHDTPKSAAQLVNEIRHNPLDWWQQKKVQSAKNEFCSRFALTSGNTLKQWKQELKTIQRKSQ